MTSNLFLAAEAVALSAAAEMAVRPAFGWVLLGALLMLIAFPLFNAMTRAGAIARATAKEAIRQPIWILLTLVGSFVILMNYYIPFFSLGEDTKMFVDCGLATMLISALLVAIWTSSQSVAEEIEGKTAITLLSKPVTRFQFILGKYIGIVQTIALMLAIQGTVLTVMTYGKVGFENKESAAGMLDTFEWSEAKPGWWPVASWPKQWPNMQPLRKAGALGVLPGMALIFFESMVMTAISVAISTRLPMLVNIVSCFAIFVVGHLTPVLVKTALPDVPFVPFVAQLFATILPSLDNFNMSSAIATGAVVPGEYLATNAIYALCYSTAMVLLALILFEDRDLA